MSASPIFFVLSGFLITRLLLEERDRTGRISSRPLLPAGAARRLLPALLVFLPLAALVNDHLGLWVREPVIATLTYTANYASVRHGIEYGSFTHLWSLAVEEHFYLVWPALVLLFPRRWLLPVCLVGIAMVAVGPLLGRRHRSEPRVPRHPPPHRRHAHRRGAGGDGRPDAAPAPRPGGWPRSCSWSRATPRSSTPLDWGFVAVALAAAVLVADALWWPATARGGWPTSG